MNPLRVPDPWPDEPGGGCPPRRRPDANVASAEPSIPPSQKERRRVWLSAWCRVAGTPHAPVAHTANQWADECLAAFDERFGQPERREP